MKTTPETIAELKRLLAEATPGPVREGAQVSSAEPHTEHWFATDDSYRYIAAGTGYTKDTDPKSGFTLTGFITPADSKLNAAARNALPSLLADIELLREAVQAISQRHPGYGGSGEIARKALAATEAR